MYCKSVILSAHLNSFAWAEAKPRRNQLANKIIEAKKRAIKVEDQAKIKLNGEFISDEAEVIMVVMKQK